MSIFSSYVVGFIINHHTATNITTYDTVIAVWQSTNPVDIIFIFNLTAAMVAYYRSFAMIEIVFNIVTYSTFNTNRFFANHYPVCIIAFSKR